MNTTTENNKLIAEFMGLKSDPDDNTICRVPDYSEKYVLNPSLRGSDCSLWADRYVDENTNTGYKINYEELGYNDSWDWLMPVVRKAEDIRLNAPLKETQCDYIMSLIVNNLQQVDIKGVYANLLSFIEWYNATQKEN